MSVVQGRCWLLGKCDCSLRPPADTPPAARSTVFARRLGGDPAAQGQDLDALLGALDVDPATGSVALKLNLCEYRDWRSGATTSLPLVKALVAALRRRCPQLHRVVLLEHDSSGTRAMDLYALLGFQSFAEEEDCELFDPAQAEWLPVDTVGALPIEIPAITGDVDLFVNIPKMKLHGKTLFTGALKNNFGLVRRKWKLPYHTRLCETIIASNLHLPRQLCVMDGSIALSGRGPAYGIPCAPGVVLGSWDPVAVDAAGARLSGLPVWAVGHIRLARQAGLGDDQPTIVWLGEDAGVDERPQIDWGRFALAAVLRRS